MAPTEINEHSGAELAAADEDLDPAICLSTLFPQADESKSSQRSTLRDNSSNNPAETQTNKATVDPVLLEANFLRIIQSIDLLPAEEGKSLLESFIRQAQFAHDQLFREVPPLPHYGFQSFKDAPADTDPYQWLQIHWGHWLKHFHPELSRDYLFLDQLGHLDPELKDALYAKRRAIKSATGLTISQIVPKKSVRLDLELAAMNQDDIRRAVSAYALPKSRQKRKTSINQPS